MICDFEISEEKILNVIRSLNPNKAHGWDEISIRMIKLSDKSLVTPLKIIFTNCLRRGVFPGIWKCANVVPVHKKNEKNMKSNYRPISLLPICGKMLEKLMYDPLYSHLASRDILDPNQSGFRPCDSTINQLLSITHAIFKAFDCNPPLDVRSVFLDISKAFDRVWHDGLIYKLKQCGVSGRFLALIISFLKDRKQRTVLNSQCSSWGDTTAGVPQGSTLGPLLFLVYINDLTTDLNCNVKLFADDTSLFTIVQDPYSASDINHDLELLSRWAHNWRMSFNPDPHKQAVELVLSTKRHEVDHPMIFFNDIPVEKVDEHKHLGVILDRKLSFSAHINAAICKARRGIGLLKHLSRYLPRHTLNELYKLHVRPFLDYGDVIYHIPFKVCEFSQNTIVPRLMEKLESVQYSAALAVTGTWRGTSRDKLYAELGWESSNSRRWTRRLTLFYKIINNFTPSYTRDPIPALYRSQYSLRRQDAVVGRIVTRTEKFNSSFYPNCIQEWNTLNPEIRLAPSVAVFKKKLLSIIRPPAKSVFGIHDPLGLSYLSQLRVGLSKLNFHKFKHNFKDTLNPLCPTNDGIEDTEHFLLLCPSFDVQRRDLLAEISQMLQPFVQINNLSNIVLIKLLLYGDKDLSDSINKSILQLTINFIHKTGRFG